MCISMREKLQRFMWGRYGNDRFNQFLFGAALVCMVLSMIFHGPFYLMAVAILVWSYYRMFSRNISRRSAENQKYLQKEMKFRAFFARKRKELRIRREFCVFKCPCCKQKLRVPRGKGKIAVTCRKCGTEFLKRS